MSHSTLKFIEFFFLCMKVILNCQYYNFKVVQCEINLIEISIALTLMIVFY